MNLETGDKIFIVMFTILTILCIVASFWNSGFWILAIANLIMVVTTIFK